MSKKKKVGQETPALPADLPLAGVPLGGVVAPPPPPVEDETESVVSLEIPLASPPAKVFLVHLDARLTLQQSSTLRQLAAALDRRQACLANGLRVVTPAQAIKYLLEQIPHSGASGAE